MDNVLYSRLYGRRPNAPYKSHWRAICDLARFSMATEHLAQELASSIIDNRASGDREEPGDLYMSWGHVWRRLIIILDIPTGQAFVILLIASADSFYWFYVAHAFRDTDVVLGRAIVWTLAWWFILGRTFGNMLEGFTHQKMYKAFAWCRCGILRKIRYGAREFPILAPLRLYLTNNGIVLVQERRIENNLTIFYQDIHQITVYAGWWPFQDGAIDLQTRDGEHIKLSALSCPRLLAKEIRALMDNYGTPKPAIGA